jgi:hypothetical protein
MTADRCPDRVRRLAFHVSSHALPFVFSSFSDKGRSKIRCLAEHPSCSSCRKRHAKCVYAASSSRTTRSSLHHVTRNNQISSHATGGEFDGYSPAVEGLNETDHSPADGDEARFDENPALPIESNVFGESNTSVRDDSTALMGMDIFSLMSEEADMQSNLSWIFDDFPDILFPSLPITSNFLSAPLPGQTLEVYSPLVTVPVSINTREKQPPDLPMLDAQELCTAIDAMPVGGHTNSTSRLVLPQLGDLDEQLPPASYFVVTSITPALRNKLLDSIRIPLEQGPWQAVSLTNFPSCQKLAHCIDLYFIHFNAVSSMYLSHSTSLINLDKVPPNHT